MDKIRDIPLDQIFVGEQKVRGDPNDDGIIELANSIAREGLLQPIGVRVREEGGYQLLWGLRRCLAHRRLGRERIEAKVLAREVESVRALALVENVQREQMTLDEEIECVLHLHKTEGLSVESVCNLIHKSRSWVLRRLAVRQMPDFLRDAVLDGSLPIGHAEEIWRVPDEGAQRYCAATAVGAKWNLATTKTVVADLLSQVPQGEPGEPAGAREAASSASVKPQYACEVCRATGSIEQFRLVRVCVGGCDPDAIARAQQ